MDENIEVARRDGKIANNARKDLEIEFGESVIAQNNTLNYKYQDETKQIDNNKMASISRQFLNIIKKFKTLVCYSCNAGFK